MSIRSRKRLLVFLVAGVGCSSLLCGQKPPVESARALLKAGLRDKAVVLLQGIVHSDPENADAHLLLGSVLATEDRRAEALKQLTELIQLRPDSAEAFNALGLALSHFSEMEAALEAFERAIALDDGLANAHVNLSLLLAHDGKFGQAERELNRALQIQATSPAASYTHYLRAKVYSEQSQFEKAIDDLEITLKVQPTFTDAWSELGIAQRALLQDSAALKAFQNAAKLNPNDADIEYRLGTQYLTVRKTEAAVLHLKESDRLRPNNIPTLYNLQRALRQRGHTKEADHILAEVSRLTRASDAAGERSLAAVQLNSAGIALEKEGDVKGALEKYRAALDLDPRHEGFQLNHGLALCRLGHWADGITEIREVVREHPENTDASRDLYIAVDQFNSLRKAGAPQKSGLLPQ
jgi:tetratricopeptide (TPR) repeat protein